MAATGGGSLPSTPRKLQKRRTKNYSLCLLYNTQESCEKLTGLSVASCNPTNEENTNKASCLQEEKEVVVQQRADYTSVSDKMSCNCCSVDFDTRDDQIKHYKSDWHRYNLRLRLKGHNSVTEERFEEISGCVSSISGSESDSEESDSNSNKPKTRPSASLLHSHLRERHNSGSSNDSESEIPAGYLDDSSRRYPKLFFRNKEGDLISLHRCVIYHKKNQPATHNELISIVTEVPHHLKWIVLMASGGHFAAAVFDDNTIVAHKTFHRYVVRAKRGTAQGSRDSQGNAPKSAGASIRRYNEAALKEDVQELISSWSEHVKNCDLIFLRAPSFNKKLFFSGKTPPLQKSDTRIRMIPFATRRPTHNEVRRVHEVLSSIECYGDEEDTADYIPVSPGVMFSRETGHLEVIPADQQIPSKQRKSKEKSVVSANDVQDSKESKDRNKLVQKGQQLQVIDSLRQSETMSSGASTGSESELVETMETLSTADLKEYAVTKKPRHKHRARKRRPSLKHQLEPDADAFSEERYHLKNSLYTACKIGDFETLQNLLVVFQATQPTNSLPDSTVCLDTHTKQSSDIACQEGTVKHLEEADSVSKHVCDSDLPNSDTNALFTENVSSVPATENNITSVSVTENSVNSVPVTENITSVEVTENSISGDHAIASTSSESINNNNADDQIDKIETSNSTERNRMSLDVDRNIVQQQELMSPFVSLTLLNEPIGDQQLTLLHVASKGGYVKLVRALLEAGADPTMKDKFGQTPYICAKDKEIRNEYRRFRGVYPDKFNYESAKIPHALTEEMEAERKKREAERKKVQRKAKQERTKIKRAEEAIQKTEEAAKNRFLSLSDREKRALAAEKRLIQQKVVEGSNVPILNRCFQCGKDITGKVPFEYYDNKFCTPKCLKEHRMSSTKR